jgi:hypothetical protein
MRTKGAALILVAGLVAPAVTLFAHHSFMAEFDQKKPVILQGVVTKVEWQNPHTYFYVDVKGTSGQTVNWLLETGSPAALMARGWTRDSMKTGDKVTVNGYLAKERPNCAAARNVKLPDGRRVFGGQTDDGGPTK